MDNDYCITSGTVNRDPEFLRLSLNTEFSGELKNRANLEFGESGHLSGSRINEYTINYINYLKIDRLDKLTKNQKTKMFQ